MITEELSKVNFSQKAEIASFANKIANMAIDGEVNPLQMWVEIKAIESALEQAKKKFEDLALEEAEGFGQKNFSYKGANVQVKESGVKFNFEEVGHKRYNAIMEEIAQLKVEAKNIETIMKAHSDVWVETDTATGETYEVAPVARQSKTTLAITFK